MLRTESELGFKCPSTLRAGAPLWPTHLSKEGPAPPSQLRCHLQSAAHNGTWDSGSITGEAHHDPNTLESQVHPQGLWKLELHSECSRMEWCGLRGDGGKQLNMWLLNTNWLSEDDTRAGRDT